MKVIALFLSLIAVAFASTAPTFVAKNRALDIRGGASIGALDEDLAIQLATAGATAYVAGAGSKFIADKSGASSTQVSSRIKKTLHTLLCPLPVNSFSHNSKRSYKFLPTSTSTPAC